MDLQTLLVSLEEVVSDGFARYSKYIIQDRAIPDARDGLKPVQRRIMYAMFKEGNTDNKPYRKSAKSVGVIIGNYHPHGDSSVYEAMVRLSQDFKMNYPLVDMHGNNGSLDGDPPAAMRYTEARLSSIAMLLLENVNKATVAFAPNFDDSELEPIVLPSYFPNLLVNGSTGISAGYATDIPPHNLGEIIDACILMINNPDAKLNDILKIVKGPDFPTGGIIQGKDQIAKAYESGKGRIVVRAKLSVEDDKNIKVINISEIPYEVNKAELVRKIEEVKYDKKVDGIIAVRDESDRKGLSIVIELKKDANEKLILNYLYKNTNLQVYYNFNMVAIVNKTPKLLGIMPLLNCYIEHQQDVLKNMSEYELEISEKRKHIIEGLIRAVDVIDEVIEIIRSSLNRQDSIKNLIKRYAFSDLQAQAIVDLRLYRLSNTDIQVLNQELEELNDYIKHLELILSDQNFLNQQIIKKLEEVKSKFARKRKSKVEKDIEEIVIEKEELIPFSEVMISISKDGYIKRSSLRSYQSSNYEIVKKEDDFIFAISPATTLNKLLLFFDDGSYAFIPVYEIQESKWKDFGKHINNYVQVNNNTKVINAMLVDDFKTRKVLVSLSALGQVKISELKDLEITRYNKVSKYMNLSEDDKIVSVFDADLNDDLMIMSSNANVLRYPLKSIAISSLRSKGVKAMNLGNSTLVGGFSCSSSSDAYLLVVFENGYAKKVKISSITLGKRATKGTQLIKNSENVLNILKLKEDNDLVVVDSTNNVSLIPTKEITASKKINELSKISELDNGKTLIYACIIENLLVSKIQIEDKETSEYQLFEDEQLVLFSDEE